MLSSRPSVIGSVRGRENRACDIGRRFDGRWLGRDPAGEWFINDCPVYRSNQSRYRPNVQYRDGWEFPSLLSRERDILAIYPACFWIDECIELSSIPGRDREFLPVGSARISVRDVDAVLFYRWIVEHCQDFRNPARERHVLPSDTAGQSGEYAIDSGHRDILAGHTTGQSGFNAEYACDGHFLASDPGSKYCLDAKHSCDRDVLAGYATHLRDYPATTRDAGGEFGERGSRSTLHGPIGRKRAVSLHHVYRNNRLLDRGQNGRDDSRDLHDIKFAGRPGVHVRYGGGGGVVPKPDVHLPIAAQVGSLQYKYAGNVSRYGQHHLAAQPVLLCGHLTA